MHTRVCSCRKRAWRSVCGGTSMTGECSALSLPLRLPDPSSSLQFVCFLFPLRLYRGVKSDVLRSYLVRGVQAGGSGEVFEEARVGQSQGEGKQGSCGHAGSRTLGNAVHRLVRRPAPPSPLGIIARLKHYTHTHRPKRWEHCQECTKDWSKNCTTCGCKLRCILLRSDAIVVVQL